MRKEGPIGLERWTRGSRFALVLAACALAITLLGLWLTGYWLLCRTLGRFSRVSAFPTSRESRHPHRSPHCGTQYVTYDRT